MLSEVTPQMPAWAQEVFGPVAPVIRFSTAEEAAALAAQTEYGLSLGILTKDMDAFTETRWITIRGDIAPDPF